MEKTQKIIIALLIIAIVFSTISIVLSLSFASVELPTPKTYATSTSNTPIGSGNLALVVEGDSR